MILKNIDGNQKNFQKKLEFILDSRKLTQNNKLNVVKPIINNVKKNGDKAVVKYEKKIFKYI